MSEEKGMTVGRTTVAIHEDMEAIRERLENYQTTINRKPPEGKKKTNRFAGNSTYLQVGYIEMLLDQMYLGLWEFIPAEKGAEVLINSVVYNGTLRVFHPVANIWISRAGTGAAPIQIDKEGRPQDKAIQQAVGAAKTYAFKNAAKSLGKKFGRDLNRQDESEYERYYTEKPVNE